MPTAVAGRPVRRPLAALVTIAALAGGVSACASTSGAGGADPAGAVPASAPVYVEASLRPDAGQAAALDRIAGRVLQTGDPAQRIVALVDRAGRRRGLTWRDDVAPWLGDRAALAVTALPDGASRTRADAVAVIASTDDDRARTALAKLLGPGGRTGSYRGVATRSAGDTTGAVLDGRLLAGAPPAVRAAIDAARGDSLADAARYERARRAVAPGGIAFAVVDPRRLLQAAVAQAGPAGLLVGSAGASVPEVVAARLDAQGDALVVDAAALGAGRAALAAAAGGRGAQALAALPAGTWLGIGVGDVGKTLSAALGGAGAGGAAVLGLDLQRDVAAWMGDGAVFVTGATSRDLAGGLVLTSTDPAASRRTVRQLGPLLRALGGGARVRELRGGGIDAGWQVGDGGKPGLTIAAAGHHVVVGGGPRVVQRALSGGATLGRDPRFTAAGERLGPGYRPSLWLDLPAVRGLAAGARAGHGGAVRALRGFGPVVGGARQDGGVLRMRFRAEVP